MLPVEDEPDPVPEEEVPDCPDDDPLLSVDVPDDPVEVPDDDPDDELPEPVWESVDPDEVPLEDDCPAF